MSDYAKDAANWSRVYDLVYSCSGISDAKIFANVALDEFRHLIPCEQARVYLFKANGSLDEYFLRGVDKRIVKDYFEYYSHVGNERWNVLSDENMYNRYMDPNKPATVYGMVDWTIMPRNDAFTREYLNQLGLKYSLGFGFFDVNHVMRLNFMLDRTSGHNFTEKEQWYVMKAVPMLNNSYRLLIGSGPVGSGSYADLPEFNSLTRREQEIVNLLFEGVSTRNISRRLKIAESTVNKHLAHIYLKMGVQNRQELLSKLARG